MRAYQLTATNRLALARCTCKHDGVILAGGNLFDLGIELDFHRIVLILVGAIAQLAPLPIAKAEYFPIA